MLQLSPRWSHTCIPCAPPREASSQPGDPSAAPVPPAGGAWLWGAPPPRLCKGGNRRDPPGVAGHRPCRWGDGAIFPNPQSRSRHRFSSTVTPAPPTRSQSPSGRPTLERSSLAARAARMARTPADGVPVDPVPARPARGHGHWTLSAARRPWTSAPSPNKPHGPLMVPRAAHPPFLCFH